MWQGQQHTHNVIVAATYSGKVLSSLQSRSVMDNFAEWTASLHNYCYLCRC